MFLGKSKTRLIGFLSKTEAKDLLQNKQPGTAIIRFSESSASENVLRVTIGTVIGQEPTFLLIQQPMEGGGGEGVGSKNKNTTVTDSNTNKKTSKRKLETTTTNTKEKMSFWQVFSKTVEDSSFTSFVALDGKIISKHDFNNKVFGKETPSLINRMTIPPHYVQQQVDYQQ